MRRKLDLVFSLWIRKRDANAEGMGRCISCQDWALLQAGHFIPRQYTAVRWHPLNVNGQCARCNCWLHGNQAEYYVQLVKFHGQETVDKLMELKHTTVNMKRADFEELIAKYE